MSFLRKSLMTPAMLDNAPKLRKPQFKRMQTAASMPTRSTRRVSSEQHGKPGDGDGGGGGGAGRASVSGVGDDTGAPASACFELGRRLQERQHVEDACLGGSAARHHSLERSLFWLLAAGFMILSKQISLPDLGFWFLWCGRRNPWTPRSGRKKLKNASICVGGKAWWWQQNRLRWHLSRLRRRQI